MKRLPPLLAPLFALALVGCGGRSSEPRVINAWVRLAAVPGRPAAAYFALTGGARAERLVRVESAMVGRIEIHESMAGPGGMTGMKPLGAVDVPARGTVAFAPGGRHLMLFDVDRAIAPGTAIPLRLGFASGRTTEAEAKTVAAGEDAPY